MGNIIWLASYPKSGNTWLRTFLTNLLSKSDEPININSLIGGPISSARTCFDDAAGIDSAHLTKEEIDLILPLTHIHRSQSITEKTFLKTHDAYTYNSAGCAIIPVEATYKVIYLLRNPLDVCVSYAHHSGHNNFDRMIKSLNSPGHVMATSVKGQNNQIHQHMLSWSQHVQSWQESFTDKLLLIRYEDMKQDPIVTFSKIVHFSELDFSENEICAALKKSAIDKLQEQEDEHGFREKMQHANKFFRKGEIGSWREELSENQVARIIKVHRSKMIEFGYLSKEGELLV